MSSSNWLPRCMTSLENEEERYCYWFHPVRKDEFSGGSCHALPDPIIIIHPNATLTSELVAEGRKILSFDPRRHFCSLGCWKADTGEDLNAKDCFRIFGKDLLSGRTAEEIENWKEWEKNFEKTSK